MVDEKYGKVNSRISEPTAKWSPDKWTPDQWTLV